MAALFAEMAPIVSAAFEAADHDSTYAPCHYALYCTFDPEQYIICNLIQAKQQFHAACKHLSHLIMFELQL